MSHASQQYAFTEPRTVKRAQVKPSEREHQTSSSAPRVSLAPAADRTLDILEFIASNGQTQAATLARELDLDYACLALVANWAAGCGDEGEISLDEIFANLEQVTAQVPPIITAMLSPS